MMRKSRLPMPSKPIGLYAPAMEIRKTDYFKSPDVELLSEGSKTFLNSLLHKLKNKNLQRCHLDMFFEDSENREESFHYDFDLFEANEIEEYNRD